MVVILGKFIARPVTEIQPTHDTQPPKEIQGTVHRHKPDLGAPNPNLLQALVLLLHQRPQDCHALWRRLVSPTPHLPDSRP